MKFPTYKEMGEKVAKEALDTLVYNGKTLREWIEIIASNDGDTISRKVLINKFEQWQKQDGFDNEEWNLLVDVINEIKNMPPATYINVATKDGTDCISRKAAINAIDECYCGGEDSCGEPWIYQENAVEAIQMIEPILPAEPKRGKWIDKGWTGDWQYLTDGRGNCWRNIVCSECGESVRQESNFCPNCGAKMEVEHNG